MKVIKIGKTVRVLLATALLAVLLAGLALWHIKLEYLTDSGAESAIKAAIPGWARTAYPEKSLRHVQIVAAYHECGTAIVKFDTSQHVVWVKKQGATWQPVEEVGRAWLDQDESPRNSTCLLRVPQH